LTLPRRCDNNQKDVAVGCVVQDVRHLLQATAWLDARGGARSHTLIVAAARLKLRPGMFRAFFVA
jgi:hypothetical protein